jgi:prepilin-type N-terminal cleavage/methylation domain-containing protein
MRLVKMKKGFTLVEMMIVVAIIAVLAGVAIPQYNKYVKKSETTEAMRFMKQIVDGELVYQAHQNNYLAFTDDNSTNAKVLGFTPPSDAKFKYYRVDLCGTTGFIVTSSDSELSTTVSHANSVYMYYPPEMTLGATSDKTLYEGNVFVQNYVIGENTGKQPVCP